MRSKVLFAFVLFAAVLLAACGGQNVPMMSQSDVEGTVNAAVQLTQTMVALSATPTMLPTDTPAPSETPTPEPTVATEDAAPTLVTTGENLGGEVPSGDWRVFQDSEGNFEISLPPTWSYIDLANGELGDKLAELLANNPKMAELYSEEAIQNMAKAGIKFYALEATSQSLSSELPTNLNIIATDLGMTISLEEYAKLNLDQLTQVYGDIEISSQMVSLGNDIQALEIRYQAPVPGADGVTRDAALLQYLLLENTSQYVLTFAGTAEAIDAGYDTFFKVAQSFKLK